MLAEVSARKFRGDADGMDTGYKTKNRLNYRISDILRLKQTSKMPLIVPITRCIKTGTINPASIYQTLRTEQSFLLESGDGKSNSAHYSILGFNRIFSLIVQNDRIDVAGDNRITKTLDLSDNKDPVMAVKSIIGQINCVRTEIPHFPGGIAGYFAYDAVYKLFKAECSFTQNENAKNLASFFCPGDSIVIDHRTKTVFCSVFLPIDAETDVKAVYADAEERIKQMELAVQNADKEETKEEQQNSFCKEPGFRHNIGKQDFERLVTDTLDYIFEGEIFQTVIARRNECAFDGEPFALYENLRKINPSQYMYFLDFGDEQIIGASPEMLVRVKGDSVMTVPIAGTRPRGRYPKEDASLAAELLADEKECAEHVMLVDLARNDLGKICSYGSVSVEEFMKVEQFSHVQHIVSTVSGRLREDADSFDAFASCFPAGTVSGAPKIRAMEIIDEMEPSTRGIYAGAVGYICFNKDMDFAIAIRTMIAGNGTVAFQTGAGIVADSSPENEFFETEAKASAMIAAIGRTGGSSS